MESYESVVCPSGYYSVIVDTKLIVCNVNNEVCPNQRYCKNRLVGVHTSTMMSCVLKNRE